MPTPMPMHEASSTEDLRVYEAPTAEEALAHINADLGASASIVDASKVLRGGVKGFFAKEHVQLRVRPHTARDPRAAPDATVADVLASADSDGRDAEPHEAGTQRDADDARDRGPEDAFDPSIAALLDRLREDQDSAEEQSFGDYLRERMDHGAGSDVPASTAANMHDRPLPPPPVPEACADATPPASAAPPVSQAAPAVQSEARDAGWEPARSGGARHGGSSDVPRGWPQWSTVALHRLGLPESFVAAAEGLDPADDAAWLGALARVLTPLCGPLPAGPAVLAGPRAARLATGLGIPVVDASEPVRLEGSVAAAITATPSAELWLADVTAERWFHVVAGGDRWQHLLFSDPRAVSWVGDEGLLGALGAASRLGLALGYGDAESGTEAAWRANPVDVAMAIRSMVPRR